MACSLLLRENAIEKLIKLIEDENYKTRSKDGFSGVCSRNRVLIFKQLLIFITMTTKSALQRDLDRFYKAVAGEDFSIRSVTKSAFSQARSKVNPAAFTELTNNILDTFYQQAPFLTFDGMRLLAIDGSTLPLPTHPTIGETFGEAKGYGPKADNLHYQARASFLFDTLNLTILDGIISPLSRGERNLAEQHLSGVGKGDLLLLDRGYACFWIMFLLRAKGAEFCMRMGESWWTDVRDFAESGEKERIVSFSLPANAREHLSEYPEMYDAQIKCRLVRVELEDGKTEYLCTSLTDTERYPHEIFGEMYHHRWGIEEAFKIFKERVRVQDFTGKTAIAVQQDFHAKIFSMNFCAVMAFPIEQKLREEDRQDRKHKKKVNQTNAIALISETLVGAILRKKIDEAIQSFDHITSKTLEVVRPNRKVPRKHRKKQPPALNYKRL